MRDAGYYCWQAMKKRCLSPRDIGYQRYGGRGISVHKAWISSFEQFIADIGPRPSLAHSIDRIDNDGNYEPGNVRWATSAEQAANRDNSLRETCLRGHPYSGDNLYLYPDGRRSCRACNAAANRAYRAQRRAS
jgi:hypothetical protein